MRRGLQWVVTAVFFAGVVLVWSGVLKARTALLAGATLELVGFGFTLGKIVAGLTRYRRTRSAGLDVRAALEDGLSVFFPRPVARLVALEPRLWVCIYRWLVRRRPLAPTEFRYDKRSIVGMFLAFVFLTTPFEILAYELLIPWAAVRWLLLLASLYAVIWLTGLFASMRVLPYRLEDAGIRIYYGILADGFVPYTAVRDVSVERRKSPEGKEGLRALPAHAVAYLAAGGRTDLTLHLDTPVMLQGLWKPTPPVSTLYMAADDPEGFAAALRRRTTPAEAPGRDLV